MVKWLNLLIMKYFFVIILFLFGFHFVNGQEVLLEKDVESDTLPKTWGPNRANFGHLYIDYGMFATNAESKFAEILQAKSYTFSIGYRYKKKICELYSVGLDFGYYEVTYFLRQYDLKILPNDITHDKEKYNFDNFYMEIYNRFNYGKRGDHIGNFIDIGGYGNLAFSIHHITIDRDIENDNFAEEVEVKNKKLTYTEIYSYGLRARIGFNRYVISANYRLSDLFKDSYNLPELPRLSCGLQIGFH